MASPTPTSPTLADLEYGYYSANTVSVFSTLLPMADSTATSEKVTLDLVGYTYNLETEDFSTLTGGENVTLSLDPTGPNQHSAAVSDTEGPAVENVTIYSDEDPYVTDTEGPARDLAYVQISTGFNIWVQDYTVTSENVVP